MVERTLEPGASVSQVAQAHQVNANLLFLWRRQQREGQLVETDAVRLLPVAVMDSASQGENRTGDAYRVGSLSILLPRGRLRIEGQADEALLRAVLEMLPR